MEIESLEAQNHLESMTSHPLLNEHRLEKSTELQMEQISASVLESQATNPLRALANSIMQIISSALVIFISEK